jgi:hypothetical protein
MVGRTCNSTFNLKTTKRTLTLNDLETWGQANRSYFCDIDWIYSKFTYNIAQVTMKEKIATKIPEILIMLLNISHIFCISQNLFRSVRRVVLFIVFFLRRENW